MTERGASRAGDGGGTAVYGSSTTTTFNVVHQRHSSSLTIQTSTSYFAFLTLLNTPLTP